MYGDAVCGAGDLNGDGYDDVVVADPGDIVADPGDDDDATGGAVYVYYGSSQGIDPRTEHKITLGGASVDRLGWSIAPAGDVDQDGYDDLIVGAMSADDAGENAGAAYVFYGSSSGLRAERRTQLLASDATADLSFGLAVAGAGDVNGDGYHDVIVGTFLDSTRASQSGAAYVYYGSADGIDVASEEKIIASDAGYRMRLGVAVSGAGDLDQDGYDDIIVGAREPKEDAHAPEGQGRVYVYYGSADGIDRSREGLLTASDDKITTRFGSSLTAAGDVDGDGYDDVVIAVSGLGEGTVYTYAGGSGGVSPARETRLILSDTTSWFGGTISAAGDTNGDGYVDLFVSSHNDNDMISSAGAAYLFHGGPAGLSLAQKLYAPDAREDGMFGWALSGAGDVDSDGYTDLLVSARLYDRSTASTESAQIYLFRGGVDSDGDGFIASEDCDDADPHAASPDTLFADQDGDGYGAPDQAAELCPGTEGYVSDGTDCDDSAASTYPGASDTCGDGVDADCDGIGGPDGDEDGDGWTYTEEVAMGTDDCIFNTADDTGTDTDTDAPTGKPEQGRCAAVQPAAAIELVLLGALVAVRRQKRSSPA